MVYSTPKSLTDPEDGGFQFDFGNYVSVDGSAKQIPGSATFVPACLPACLPAWLCGTFVINAQCQGSCMFLYEVRACVYAYQHM